MIRVRLRRRLHSKAIPQNAPHRAGSVRTNPRQSGDQRCFPSARRFADTSSSPMGSAGIHFRGETLYKEVVGPAGPRNQTTENRVLMPS